MVRKTITVKYANWDVPPMRVAIAIVMLLTAALSGCTDEGSGPDGGEEIAADAEQIQGMEPPTWSVGDYWTYEAANGNTWSLVVTSEDARSYTLDTDSSQLAFFHDVFDELGYVGSIDKASLAGDESGSKVAYFDWPMEGGKTWTMNNDGDRFQMEAHGPTDGKFHIVGKQGDVIRQQYEYDENIGWFTWYSWSDEEGEEAFRIDLVDNGSGWTGETIRLDVEELESFELSGASPGTTHTYTNTWGDDWDMFVQFAASCETGAYNFAFGTPESAGEQDEGFGGFTQGCPFSTQFFGIVSNDDPDDASDDWGITYGSGSQDLGLTFTAWVAQYERITL